MRDRKWFSGLPSRAEGEGSAFQLLHATNSGFLTPMGPGFGMTEVFDNPIFPSPDFQL